jgi:hypothetical protein
MSTLRYEVELTNGCAGNFSEPALNTLQLMFTKKRVYQRRFKNRRITQL